MKTDIRRLKLTDSEKFFNLRLESLQNAPYYFLSSYEDEKKSGPEFYEAILKREHAENIIFGAFINDQLVGIVGVYQSTYPRLKHKATLWGTYVAPEKRKMGIAKKLIQLAISHARDQMKCAVINLTVGNDNLSAKRLYEILGFKKWGTEPRSILIDENYFDEDHMYLFIK
jgi:RimJ/RimL family protein N-acetyltransferase